MEIKFLTQDEHIKAICTDYWQIQDGCFVETVSVIVDKYGITNPQMHALLEDNIYVSSSKYCCSSCKEPYRYRIRKNYINRSKLATWECQGCTLEHKAKELEVARQKEEKHNAEVKALLEVQQGIHLEFCPRLDELKPVDIIYLSALIRHSAAEDLTSIHPLTDNQTNSLGVDEGHSKEIIEHLENQGLIYLNPEANYGHINKTEDRFTYNFKRANWCFSKPPKISCNEYVGMLDEKVISIAQDQSNVEFLRKSCQDFALRECMFYFAIQLRDRGLPARSGNKTKAAFKFGLQHFSVSQMYYFIWMSAKQAIDHKARLNTPSHYASNIASGNIRHYVDKALNEGWKIKSFNRTCHYPQSTVSTVLYNSILRVHDGGFEHKTSDLSIFL